MHILLLALVLAWTAAAQAPPLQARFIGQMAFAITDGSTTLITDFPYEIGYAGAPPFGDRELQETTQPTLALITHRHLDHFDPAAFAKTNWKMLGPSDAAARIKSDRVLPLAPRVTFGALEIESIKTPHHNLEHYSYIVTWHGRRLYFSGDTESADSLLAAQRLDVAFVSSWQFQAARRVGGAPIDAKRIVIYHHRSGDQITGCSGTCVAPRLGDTVEIR